MEFLGCMHFNVVALNKIDFIQEGTISIGKTSIPVADTHKSNLNKINFINGDDKTTMNADEFFGR